MKRQYIRTLVALLIALVICTLLPAETLDASDSSAILSFQPDTVEVPFINFEHGIGRFYIRLHLSNVQNLDWFKFSIIFDGDILLVPDWEDLGRPEPSEWSGGGTSSGHPGYGSYTYNYYQIRNPISGSGILLTFLFEPKTPGATEIQFRDVEFKNTSGEIIPVITEGTVVNIIPFDTWIDGEYENLSTEYNELQTQYNDMEVVFDTLSNEYVSLNSNYTSLQDDYSLLSYEYTLLESDYTTLNSIYNSLELDYEALQL